MNSNYKVLEPIIDTQEEKLLDELTERYNNLIKPSAFVKAKDKIVEIVPDTVKELGISLRDNITEAELYMQAMKVVAEGFKVLEEQASKYSISESTIIKK